MSFLKPPHYLETSIDAHKRWLQIIKEAEVLLEDDAKLQFAASKGIRIKERSVPPEILGRLYGQYCDLINRIYDSYLNSIQLQRAPYMLEIVSVFVKRMYELRNELVNLIVNDYIYVDESLKQLRLMPHDIQIVVPYHFALEAREEKIENLLQKMWADAIRRKNKRLKKAKPKSKIFDNEEAEEEDTSDDEKLETVESVHSVVPEEHIHATIIQKQERFRQFYQEDFRAKCNRRKMYFAANLEEAPMEIKTLAAKLIQRAYRKYMEVKRQHQLDIKKDILLGLLPDRYRKGLKLEVENNKMYERKRMIRERIKEVYMKELEKENLRLVVFKKNAQIDDVTDHVKEWLKEWYYGYGFFPDYPYEVEGGTLLVIRGDYPTIAEKIEEDEKFLAATKGKTKEMLKAEKKQAKQDAILKEAQAKEQMKKEAEQLFKWKCNPFVDPGYLPQKSVHMDSMIQVLQNYRASWSINDQLPPSVYAETVYGYMKSVLTEDLMSQIHVDCRKYVDEFMRLETKLLIQSQQRMYKLVGWTYPKMRGRPKPKLPPVPKPLKVNDDVLKNLEQIFDLGIVTKPTSKLNDIFGDYNYGNYELNIRDPNARFPSPSYGDVKRRLILSCVFGAGIERGAPRNRSVMLLGPERNGKSFLVDCVAGELNAVKIDITPEVFTAVLDKPAKVLTQVFNAARLYQPAVIFMRNIERVFLKKIPPEDKYLKAKTIKTILPKLVKQIITEDKIIFIATCSHPLAAQTKPMVSIFSEMILVPRTDYGTLQLFLSEKLQSIRSMPRDYCVQSLAQILQGYGFGIIIEMLKNVMSSERIIKLNVTPFSGQEFLDYLIEHNIEPVTLEDYEEFSNFFIQNSPLAKTRAEFEVINKYRAIAYIKMAKAEKKKAS